VVGCYEKRRSGAGREVEWITMAYWQRVGTDIKRIERKKRWIVDYDVMS
jgi:hypothetical protein